MSVLKDIRSAAIHSAPMDEGAWDLAMETARSAGVDIRPLTSLEAADDILRVMVATWGDDQLLPREVIRAFQASGNVPLGAFEGDELVGYVLGFLGPGEEDLHVHSHMLAVLPGRRSGGVGFALKLGQRAQALDAGIRTVRWTFDPLQARNAYFNLEKLRVVADRFQRHFYGDMTDLMNRGDRSDRLEARWDLGEQFPLRDSTAGRHPAVSVVDRQGEGDAAQPVGPLEQVEEPALVAVPDDYAALRERDPALAGRWRDAVAGGIEACIAAGMVATGFIRGRGYLFERERRGPT